MVKNYEMKKEVNNLIYLLCKVYVTFDYSCP